MVGWWRGGALVLGVSHNNLAKQRGNAEASMRVGGIGSKKDRNGKSLGRPRRVKKKAILVDRLIVTECPNSSPVEEGIGKGGKDGVA